MSADKSSTGSRVEFEVPLGQDDGRTVTVPLGSPLPVSDLLSPGTSFGERYEIREVLGSGGFAVVYRAFDRELKREVALKVLRVERMSDAGLQRFRREAAVARDIASPRLLRTFDIGRNGDVLFLTMEVVDGSSLHARLRNGPLPIEEAIRVTGEILEGLSVLHGLGIVHRDVKPGNVLLAEDGVKLADFGLARRFEDPETRVTIAEAPLGTFEYMAPEQVMTQKVDGRTDLYSVGLVLFEMLTGEIPCKKDSSLGTLLAHLHADIPDVRRKRSDVPRWLARIVARLVEKEPSDRYQSAEEVLADLHSESASLFDGRRFRRFAAVAALTLAVGLAFAWALARSSPSSRFSHLIGLPGSGVAAIGRQGETLWTLPDVDPEISRRSTLARLSAGGPPLIATVLLRKREYLPEVVQILSYLDPETGKIVKQVRLESGASFFRSFSNRFCPTDFLSHDFDDDGIDEVMVAYSHSPEEPFYAVLYEPRYERSRVAFSAWGGHGKMAAQDLDDDGHDELIFFGINNHLGWYLAAAAVPLKPWIGEGLDEQPLRYYSPDDPESALGPPLWYALLPRGVMPDQIHDVIRADPDSRTLEIVYRHGSVSLSFDGFLPLPTSTKTVAIRQEHRHQAYQRMREAFRLLTAGFNDEAVAEIDAAVGDAEMADDPILEECIRRHKGKILAGVHRFDEAETVFSSLAEKSPNASDIAFDAAEAFHLQGELQRAVTWYLRGSGPGGTQDIRQSKFEYLEGAVLALVELGHFEEAFAEEARFAATYNEPVAAFYREYARWRSGAIPRFEELSGGVTDTQRYWLLEYKNARGGDAADILSAVEALQGEVYQIGGALLSLKAELLLKLGRKDEALSVARQGFDQLTGERMTNTLARAHLDLAATRLARAARANGDEELAARAEREAREMLAQPSKR